MQLNEYLEKTNMSVYALSKRSGVPYSTTLSICRGKADIEECRLSTLRALAKALDVSLLDLINGDLKPKTHTFINGKIDLDVSSLPSSLRTFIAELEEYDSKGDTAFFAAADTMFLLADRLLKEGSITEETYEKLALKYPLGD